MIAMDVPNIFTFNPGGRKNVFRAWVYKQDNLEDDYMRCRNSFFYDRDEVFELRHQFKNVAYML